MSIFREKDKVYHFGFGEGVVTSVDNSLTYGVGVQFVDESVGAEFSRFTHDGRRISTESPSLSFKPYTLTDGGFCQKRPPEYKKGQAIFVKFQENDTDEWLIRFFSHQDETGVYCFKGQKQDGDTVLFKMHSEAFPWNDKI